MATDKDETIKTLRDEIDELKHKIIKQEKSHKREMREAGRQLRQAKGQMALHVMEINWLKEELYSDKATKEKKQREEKKIQQMLDPEV